MKRITVDLAMRQRDGSVAREPADAYATATPGLAVRRLRNVTAGGWVLDHVPTGKALPGAFGTRMQAASRAARLGELCDWTLEEPPAAACGACSNGTTRSGACGGCDGLGMVKAAEAVAR